ncbi:MAG: hypothetical protein EPO21_16405 [Chloroflexota bacterium]|nr:MAG: hypothetical protein EPO21_16405 [Chloroflexota bacterium]
MPEATGTSAPPKIPEETSPQTREPDSSPARISRRVSIHALTQEHHDFLLLLLLFVAMRGMALLFIDQNGPLGAGTAHDYWFYRSFAELTLRGQYPFVDYWLEYQPVFAWLAVGAYKLSLLIPPVRSHLFSFYMLLGGLSMLADVGNLTLVYLICRRCYGVLVGQRAAMIYALLLLPLYITLGWYDSIPAFLLLASLYLLLAGHPRLGALVSGMGFMTKLLPALLLPVAVRVLWRWRDRVVYVAVWTATVAVIAAPFALINGAMLVASFRAALVRSSWETIWALLESYYGVGVVAALEDHFRPESAAWQGHPSTMPWTWITLAFVMLGGVVYLRREDWRQPTKIVALTAFTVGLFFLWSKGYSPQFAVYVLPFIIVLLPNLWGAVLILLYSLSNFLTFPLYELFFTEQSWVLWLATLGRTLVLAIMTVEAAAVLHSPLQPLLRLAKARLARPAAVGLVLLFVVSGAGLYRAYSDQGDYYLLKRFVEPLSTTRQLIVVSSSEAFAFVHPQLPKADYWIMPEDWDIGLDRKLENLKRAADGASQIWLVLDGVRGDDGRFGLLQSTLQKYGAEATNTWFDTFRLVNIVPPAGVARTVPRQTAMNVLFGEQLELQSVGLSADSVASGTAVRLAMQWKADQPLDRNLSLFVHMLLPDGRIYSQLDLPLINKGLPTSRWGAGEAVQGAANLPVSSGAPPVEYRLVLGVYDPKSGQRLPISSGQGGADSIDLGTLKVTRAPFVRAKKLAVQPIVEFQDGLGIKGSEGPTEIRPGGVLQLSLFWQLSRAGRSDLIASYQLVDEQGQVIAQQFGAPGSDAYPISQWPVGEIVRDRRQLQISPDTRPGLYRLLVAVRPAGNSPDAGAIANGQEILTVKVVNPR